jgi:hypothetical protein
MNIYFRPLIWMLILSMLGSGCTPSTIIPSQIVVSNNPPEAKRSQVITSGAYITIQPNKIAIYKSPRIGTGNFRLLVIMADDNGNSGGMFCPGTNTITVRDGDVIEPCTTAISFPEGSPQEYLYILLVGINLTLENQKKAQRALEP